MAMNWNNFINSFLKPEVQDTLKSLRNFNNSTDLNSNITENPANSSIFGNKNPVIAQNVLLNAQAANQNAPAQQNAPTTNQNQFPVGEFLFNAEVSELQQQQTTQMVKELFQLPKELTEFLQMATKSNPKGPVCDLILLFLDIGDVANILQQNGKNALSNLYRIIAEFNKLGVQMKSQEITELAKLINTAIRQTTSTDVQTLKTIMLLYLPWLPLTDNEAFKLEISQKKNDDVSDSEDSITLLITTVNYYNLQASIAKNGNDSVNVNVICAEEFPSSELESGLAERSVKFNVPINFEAKVQESKPKEKNEERKMKIFMNTSPGVNPFLLLIANSVLNIVHKIDDMDSLREKRSQQL